MRSFARTRRRQEPPKPKPYFHYAPMLSQADATCKLCGYAPDRFVDNPTKCLSDHVRRVHREHWMRTRRRVYYIQEEP